MPTYVHFLIFLLKRRRVYIVIKIDLDQLSILTRYSLEYTTDVLYNVVKIDMTQ